MDHFGSLGQYRLPWKLDNSYISYVFIVNYYYLPYSSYKWTTYLRTSSAKRPLRMAVRLRSFGYTYHLFRKMFYFATKSIAQKKNTEESKGYFGKNVWQIFRIGQQWTKSWVAYGQIMPCEKNSVSAFRHCRSSFDRKNIRKICDHFPSNFQRISATSRSKFSENFRRKY